MGFSLDLAGFEVTRVSSGGGRNDAAFLDTAGVVGAMASRRGKATLTLADQQIVAMGFDTVQSSLPQDEPVDADAQIIRSQPVAGGDELAAVVGNAAPGACTWVDLPYTFVVGLGREALVRKIEFIWDAADGLPVDYSIAVVDRLASLESVHPYDPPTVVRNARGQVQVLDFSGQPLRAAYLRIVITGEAGGIPTGLRRVRMFVDAPTPLQAILLDPANAAPWMSAVDHNNPLWIFVQAIPVAVQKVAEWALQGLGELTDHQKIVAFMHLLDTARIGYASGSNAVTALLENIGACGTWSNTLVAMATAVGIPARFINLSNYPANNGHTVTELFIDGHWSVYDPTYGIYYTTEPDNSADPYVLGFDELRAGRGDDPDISRVVGNPQRLAVGGSGAAAYAGPAIYELADPAGLIGPDRPMVFPLHLDLATKPAIGKVDFGPLNQGSAYLGSAYVNNSQEFTLSGLTPGEQYTLTVVYDWAGGYPAGQTVFDASSQIVSGGTLIDGGSYAFVLGQSNAPWTIRFTADTAEVTLLLTHSYLDYFYLVANSYTLAAA